MNLKFIKILLVNLLLVIFFFFFLELFIFFHYKNSNNITNTPKFIYSFSEKITLHGINNLNKFFNGNTDDGSSGRAPEGLEYKGPPIIIFGCSFAHGQYLKSNQTFSYKLSHTLKRPVYNRAIPGGSIQQMYYQVCDHEFNKYFYRDIPDADTVIYIMISDHYRRAYSYVFFDFYANEFQPIYKLKNDIPVLKKDNFIKKLLKLSYISKYANEVFVQSYLENEKNAEDITNFFITFFVNSKKCIEKQYNKKIKYIVILYEEIPYEDILQKKLEANGFYVIKIKDLTNINMNDYKFPDNGHPTEEAWNILVPLIVDKINSL